MACGDSVVEEVGHKVLEIFRGETCNGCLAEWKKWAEKVWELSRKYGEEH